MNMDQINIGDILLNKTNAGNEVLIVTGKSLDTSRYGSCYITTITIQSFNADDRGKEKVFTPLALLRGIEKIA